MNVPVNAPLPEGEQEEGWAASGAPPREAGEPTAPVGPSIAPTDPEDELPYADTAQAPEPEDLEALAVKAGKADQYLELAQRTQADFENFRKRAARDAAAAQARGVAKLAKELLPAVDNLDRALEAAQRPGDGADDEHTLISGIKLVHTDVIAALARVGIEPFDPTGELFDPQRHEAVAQQPVEGAEPGTIVEVYQRGYRLGDTILRPARVVVAG